MLSHELRTPLTPVLTTLNVWEVADSVPPELKRDVEVMRRNVELEARIIDDLLDLTRISRGVLVFNPEVMDVHSLLGLVVDMTQSEARAKHITIDTQLTATLRVVETDVARLQQVLWNVLRNAVNYTDEKGRVVV